MVVHVEVALLCVVVGHERTQGTSGLVADPLEIFDDALVLLLYFALDLLD